MVKQWILLSLLVCNSVIATAQVNCFAEVSLDRHSVYVQQPFKVTITVLTATWYTAPLDFDNIQIPNAFILPFNQTTPGMFTVDGRQYAGLQFYFIVFPYQAGSFVVPSIPIVAQTPSQGSSKSRKITIHTSAQHFTVKPVPAHATNNNWFVAKNVSITEHWSKPLQHLQTGDVVERTITIEAAGTLPQFIPPLQKQPLGFATTYLQAATLHDERNDYDANGRLTQKIVYLLEKEGSFIIPAIPVVWWNPNSNKLYTRSAPAGRIQVTTNASLGMLTTLKDSLDASNTIPVVTVTPIKTIWGIRWYWALLIVLAGLLLLYRIIRLLVTIWQYYQRKHALYLASEGYAFKRFLRSSPTLPSFLRTLYTWWDSWPIPGKSASISLQMNRQQYPSIAADLKQYFIPLYQAGNRAARAGSSLQKSLRAYRKQTLHTPADKEDNKVSIYQYCYKE